MGVCVGGGEATNKLKLPSLIAGPVPRWSPDDWGAWRREVRCGYAGPRH